MTFNVIQCIVRKSLRGGSRTHAPEGHLLRYQSPNLFGHPDIDTIVQFLQIFKFAPRSLKILAEFTTFFENLSRNSKKWKNSENRDVRKK